MRLAFPELYAKDIEIQVTSDDILVKAELSDEDLEEKETIHIHEFASGRMFKAIRLPKRIYPDKVQAQLKNGMLTITAEIAEASRAKTAKLEAA